MKTIISFYLQRRFLNRTMILLNIVIFIARGVVFHLDRILAPKDEYPVYLDGSCSDVSLQLMNMDSLYADSTEGLGKYHTLHYDDGWILHVCEGNGESLKNKVENDLRQIRKDRFMQNADLRTRDFLNRFCRSFRVETSENNAFNGETVIVSVIFYLVLTYSNMIANELIYEKASHTLDLIISLTGERVHFLSKIATAYLSLLIQGVSVMISVFVWLFIRFKEDHLRGLLDYINNTSVTADISLSGQKLILIFITIMAGLLLIQIIMLIITSLLKNSEEMATFQNIYYILLVVIYYVFILKNQNGLGNGVLRSILSFVPVSSMVIIPVRLMNNTVGTTEALISLTITVTAMIVISEVYLSRYRRILLK